MSKYRDIIFFGVLAAGLAGLSQSAPGQSLQSSEEQYVRAWHLQKQGSFDAALEGYEASAKAAVVSTQRKKSFRAIGEVATRAGGPAALRQRGYAAFEQAALLNDGFSLGQLVDFQDKNIYRPVRLTELIPLYETRARNGSNTTAMLLGRMHEKGEIGPRSQEKALEWYRLAAQNGNGKAGLKLATYHASRNEDKEALRWLKMTREGLSEAELRARVARVFIEGTDAPRNFTIARRWAVGVLSIDPAVAMLLLRKILEVEFDLDTFEAMIAANTKITGEDRMTLSMMRRILDAQPSATQDKAAERILLLADKGNPFAAACAASMLFQKNGFNHPRGMSLLMGSLKAGEPEAVRLGTDAIATLPADSKNRMEIFSAIRASADKGTAAAMLALANIYSVGGLVQQDIAESFKWKLRAAQTGDAAGAFETGMAYLGGNGVTEDKNAARKWLEKAKRSGNQMAGSILQQMASSKR
jgi:uncharacterized protein